MMNVIKDPPPSNYPPANARTSIVLIVRLLFLKQWDQRRRYCSR